MMSTRYSYRIVTAALAVCLAYAAAQPAVAQLTTENLIGDSVSLSNQSYPEIEKAIERFRNNDVESAREYLDRAKEKYTKLPPTDITLAKMQVMARNGKAARILLERAVVDSPDDPEAYLLLADEAFASGRTTEAAVLFEKSNELTEAFDANAKRKAKFLIRVAAGRAGVAERRQQWEAARGLLGEWLKLDPDSAAAHQRMGITYYRLGQPGKAIEEFSEARKIRTEFNHPSITLGQLYARDGNQEKAREAFESGYKAESSNESTARAYAEYLLQNDNLAKAAEVSNQLLAENPEEVSALLLNGVISQIQKNRDQAETALNKVLTIDPGNAEASNLLALILIESDSESDQQKALRHAEVNSQRFQKSAQASVTLAWVLHKLGRDREAQEALKKVSGSNLNSDSGYLVARMISDLGQKENALKMIQQVLQQSGSMLLFEKDANQLLEDLGGAPTLE